jgi:hypothetical protein
MHQPQEVFAPSRGLVVPNGGCKIIKRSFLHAPRVETSRGEGERALRGHQGVLGGGATPCQCMQIGVDGGRRTTSHLRKRWPPSHWGADSGEIELVSFTVDHITKWWYAV